MRQWFLLLPILLLSGCINSKNLSFESSTPNEFRVTFDCRIPLNDMRFYGQFINNNSTKTIYYVDHKNIVESRFEITSTKVKSGGFSLEDYINFIKQEGAMIEFNEIYNGIAYLNFLKKDQEFYQLVSANNDQINIVNIEPMLFQIIYQECTQKKPFNL